jgi:hypothetical protein
MAIGLPAHHEERRKHLMTKSACESKVKQVLEKLSWIEIGYEQDAFDYRTRGTMLTFAERVLIYVGATEILVKSACLFPGQFLDFGKNRKNVEEFYGYFEGK